MGELIALPDEAPIGAEGPDLSADVPKTRVGSTVRLLACIAFTAQGEELARRVAQGVAGASASEADGPFGAPASWPDARGTCLRVSVTRGFGPGKADLAAWVADAFAHADALLFVGAAGIAVRAIAPHVRSKASDPAVLVMDATGRWVIPLLSGHIGGANRLAERIARLTGAQAVLTTATDARGLWAIDDWAAAQGLAIANPAAIKGVAAKLLAGQTVRLFSEEPLAGDPPAQVEPTLREAGADVAISPYRASADGAAGPSAGAGEASELPDEPPDGTGEFPGEPPDAAGRVGAGGAGLRLVPRVIWVGIGCRRGATVERIEAAWQAALDALAATGPHRRLDERAVRGVASIDLKAHEPGLLAFCARHGWALTTFSAHKLAQVQGARSSSAFVREVTGVDNVCERAALAQGGTLLLPKCAHDGVTIALARTDARLSFPPPTPEAPSSPSAPPSPSAPSSPGAPPSSSAPPSPSAPPPANPPRQL